MRDRWYKLWNTPNIDGFTFKEELVILSETIVFVAVLTVVFAGLLAAAVLF